MEVFEIETERLQLRQFRVEDAQDVFAIFSDEQTTLDCGGYLRDRPVTALSARQMGV